MHYQEEGSLKRDQIVVFKHSKGCHGEESKLSTCRFRS